MDMLLKIWDLVYIYARRYLNYSKVGFSRNDDQFSYDNNY